MATTISDNLAPIIEAKNIVKRFGGAVAVDDVSLTVSPGEIHAVVGENGAGKSTLMRVLAGILDQDSGEVTVGGALLTGGAKQAIESGVSLVHQELSLVPEMTVAENILLGSAPTTVGFTRQKEQRQIAKAALDSIGVSVDLDERIARLSVALRQFVEIARAVARAPRVLILDEPTATLTPAETTYLLDMLQRLAENGMAIVYISHRIPEVFRICHTVTVLRDGRRVSVSPIGDITPESVIDEMVGRELKNTLGEKRAATTGEVVLSVDNIRAHRVNGISLDVRAGEIVGLGGLVGAGRTELVRAIIGADERYSGRVTIIKNGVAKPVGGFQQAVRLGVAYVPEERRTDGLALSLSVSDNIALPNRRELSRAGFLLKRKIGAFAQELADKVGLRPPEINREVGEYSGGNQQKVVLAKWLGRRPDIIVLDEPTRGVDVGAKAEIHRLVKEIADEGTAVLMVSSDLPELLELADVVHVVRDGIITGTLDGNSATEKEVMSLAAGEKTMEDA